MLESHRIGLEMSKLREANARTLTDDSASTADRAKVERRVSEIADLEVKYRCAVEKEAKATPNDGEARELRNLHTRASCRAVIDAVVNERATDGAEAEAQAAAGLMANGIPWGMLVEPELRVDADAGTPSTIGETQRPIIDRVFARSALASLGVQLPAAGVGDELFYVVTAGADGAYAGGVTAVDAGDYTLDPKVLSPNRLTAAYLVKQEDLQRIKGYEAALRGDLRMALSNRMDAQLLGAGNGTQRGFLATPSNGGIAARARATADVTYALALQEAAQAIDGIYANMCSELAWVVGEETYRKLAALVNTGSGETFIEHATKLLRRIRASANIPAIGTNAQEGIIAKTGNRGVNAICPVWGGGPRIIRDEITQADTGRIRLTVLAFYSFMVLRADGFQRTSLKIT